jgi:hypothetical protein
MRIEPTEAVPSKLPSFDRSCVQARDDLAAQFDRALFAARGAARVAAVLRPRTNETKKMLPIARSNFV